MTDLRTRYAVTITFDDGEVYNNHVTAQDSNRAFFLALQDSRMASPFGSFQAPVKHWDSVIAELEEV